MLNGLRLLIRTTVSTRQMSCALCGELFQLDKAAATLYDGSTPRGYVCPDCVAAGPGPVAGKLRGRAHTLREQAEKLRSLFPGEEWVGVVQATHERAEYWDHLADRVGKLTHWTLEEN